MQRYLLGRLLQSIVSLLAVLVIVFILARLTGDPVELLLSESATQEQREELRASLGLDKPVLTQLGIFLVNVSHGDFGKSIRTRRPAIELVLQRLPASLQLAAIGIAMIVVFGLSIGVYSALRRGTPFDLIARAFAVLGQSTPTFWFGLILMQVFAIWLGILPSAGREGWKYAILPSITLGFHGIAGVMRMTRSSMLDVLPTEYVKLARIKGLSETAVVWKHAFKNAALPVITFSVLLFVALLAGAVVTETVFAWPGAGRLLIEAVRWRDFPLVQAGVALLASLYILGNLMVDLLYAYLNPKIRYGKMK